MKRNPMSDEARAKLSAALKEKWQSGTRKKNPAAMYVTAKRTLAEGFATGRIKKITPPLSVCSAGGRTMTEKKYEAIKKVAAQKVGVPNPAGPSERGPNNMFSKFWILIDPDRNVIAGPNLNEIVRRHAHLFEPNDLRLTGKGSTVTYAAKRLSDLFRIQKRKGCKDFVIDNWKGWRAGDRKDMIKNIGIPFDKLKCKPHIGEQV